MLKDFSNIYDINAGYYLMISQKVNPLQEKRKKDFRIGGKTKEM